MRTSVSEAERDFSEPLEKFRIMGGPPDNTDNELKQWFPTFFHLRTPWQPISINCAIHISKMFVINIVAVISNLYVVPVNK
jgi:hypothetical protein